MSPTQTDELSDTEHLILAYLQSHAPEECMLDKISAGISKSRATVLKYLGMLHARGIIGYRLIGRNKLWMLKEAGGAEEKPEIAGAAPPSPDSRTLASLAFEMHELILRETELADDLDRPETIVLTVTDDLAVVCKNRLFASLFPGAVSFRDLVRPAQAAKFEGAMQRKKSGAQVSLELDLMEKAGIFRPYRLTLFPGGPAGGTAVVGEDLSDRKRTRRHLEALLSIIRAAGSAPDEEHLLDEAMTGIREKLLPYVHGAVFMADMRMAYGTFALSESARDGIAPFLARAMTTLGTVAAGKDDGVVGLLAAACGTAVESAVAVPILEEERATGAVLLLLDDDATATDIENVEMVADEIASALKMQRLDRERAEYVNTLLAMNRISGVLNDTRDEGSILAKSIDSAMKSLGFEMGCVYLRDEADEMALRVQRNMPESLRQMCLSGSFDRLFDLAFRERRVIYITRETPEYAGLSPDVKASGVATILVMPIRIGDEIVGLLNMGSTEEKHYTQTSLENISSIGLQLGMALERSRLARALEGDHTLPTGIR